jgi:HTH-type transcriptional regulator/antitoxin HigA
MKSSTLDETKYGKLLAKARPHVIHNHRDLEHFTEVLLEFDEVDHPSREERELADILTTLIEQYEAKHYKLRKATPTEMIQFLLEQQGLSAKDLWPVIGSKGNTSEILSGKRKIGPAMAAKLADFFHVAPELFIDWKPIAGSSANFRDEVA